MLRSVSIYFESEFKEMYMKKKTFISYLIDQFDREDPVGDLSRDFARDNTYNRLYQVLKSRPYVCGEAREALEKARMEWENIDNDD